MKFLFNKDSSNWKEWTLLMPTISVGNVDQIAVSYIIENLEAKFVGHVMSQHQAAMVGCHNGVKVTSCDAYESEVNKLLVLQLRAPIIRKQFMDEIADWVKKVGFFKVVLLCGVIACERTDQQLSGTQCRYILSDSLKHLHPMLKNSVPLLEERPGGGGLFMPGSGGAVSLIRKCAERSIPTIALMRFTYEGHNTQDGLDLAHVINLVFNWIPLGKERKEEWKKPSHLRQSLGNSFDQILYM